MTEEKNRGIIFDFDGTLVQTSDAIKYSIESTKEYLVEKCNILPTTADLLVKNFVDLCKSGIESAHNCDDDKWREKIWQKVLTDSKTINVEIDLLYKHYKESFLELIEIKNETKNMLKDIQSDYKTLILTNGNSEWQRIKLEKCEVMNFVDEIIISGDHNINKPDPNLFHLACLRLGLENKHCIIVGNNKKTDIFGGCNAGLKATVWVRDKQYDNDSIEPDYIINDICELKAVLEKISF